MLRLAASVHWHSTSTEMPYCQGGGLGFESGRGPGLRLRLAETVEAAIIVTHRNSEQWP